MAKKASPTKTKAVSGGKKPPSNKKILLMSLPIAAVVLGAAWFGWNTYQQKSLEAQAAGWTVLAGKTGTGNVALVGCKQSVSSAYGPLWKIKLVLANDTNEVYGADFTIVRADPPRAGAKVVSATKLLANPKQWIVKEAYASQLGVQYAGTWTPDRFGIMVGTNNRGGGNLDLANFINNQQFSTMTFC